MNQLLRLLCQAGLTFTEPRKRQDARDYVTDRIDDLTDNAARGYHRAVDRIERLYHVARGDDHRALYHVASFAIGLGVGVGTALLFAPASGSETRSAIARKGRDIQDEVRARVSRQVDRVSEAAARTA